MYWTETHRILCAPPPVCVRILAHCLCWVVAVQKVLTCAFAPCKYRSAPESAECGALAMAHTHTGAHTHTHTHLTHAHTRNRLIYMCVFNSVWLRATESALHWIYALPISSYVTGNSCSETKQKIWSLFIEELQPEILWMSFGLS